MSDSAQSGTQQQHGDLTRNPVAAADDVENSAVLRPTNSYADVVRPVQENDESVLVVDVENEVPYRPCTAVVNPRIFLPAHDFFGALNDAAVDPKQISCVQRMSSGAINITFRHPRYRESFLKRNTLEIHGQQFALQDVDQPLTYLQIFDAPYEMPDTTIINRLSAFCDVMSHRRGYFRLEGLEKIQDGVRHYRVRIKRAIPSFLRFGKILIHLRYEGQTRTCRHCNQPGHYANTCRVSVCYNCDSTGHLASDCPEPIRCNICKSVEHKARFCSFSWAQDTSRSSSETSDNDESEDDAGTPTPPTDQPSGTPPSTENTPETQPTETMELLTEPENVSEQPVQPAHPLNATDLTRPTEPTETAVDGFLSAVSSPVISDAEDETMTDETGSASKPFTPSVQGRIPAKPPPVTIPTRKPTAPTLVTGKPANKNTRELSDSSETGEPSAKKRNTNNGRTKKHKHK